MIDFLRQYWQLFVYAALMILSLLTLVLKRRSKVEVIDNSMTNKLVEFITEAEDLFGAGNGSQKLKYVIDRYLAYSGLPASDNIVSVICLFVEAILETPQKKGK